MKMTLLEMVQDILNDMDADEVSTIDDTIEAQQVAQILKTTFFEMLGNRRWPHTGKLIVLTALGDVAKPNYLRLPEHLSELSNFRYNTGDANDVKYQEVLYKEPDAFLRLVSNRSQNNTATVTVTDFSGTKLAIRNDAHPRYWTSFDDTHVVTDSWNKTVDDTLKQSKTQCFAFITPEWVRTDEAIPDLPIDAFPALLAEAKSTAFLSLKQMPNQKAEQRASRQQRWLARKAWRAEGGVKYQNYGRAIRK